MNDHKKPKNLVKKYATQFILKLTTKHLNRLIPKQQQQDTLPSIQFDNSSFSDEDEIATPTDSMILLMPPLDNHHHKSNSFSSTISAFDGHRNRLTRIRSFNSSSEQVDYSEKQSKAIAMWQSTVQKLIIQKRVVQSMEHYIKKQKYTERDEALSRFILNELHSTEKSFYQFLIYIQKNYMEPMVTASQAKNSLVKSSDIHVLFNYLPELIDASHKLLVKLEEIQDPSPGLAIGGVFKAMEPEFVVFLKYAIHYQTHCKSIRRASTSGFVTKINNEKRHEHNRLGISDYLIAPFQRVPRYELLLKDLLKHTDMKGDEDELTNDLIYANNLIRGLAATMNNVQEKITFLSTLS